MIREEGESEVERILSEAMQGDPPPVGKDLERYLVHWLTISSVYQPGQASGLRFPFLKWAIRGRAKEVMEWLSSSDDPESDVLCDELERIASLPFPPRNERAQKDAYEMWAWLKEELHGSLGGA